MMNIPSNLNDVQPRANQVWNCGEIGSDPNLRWKKSVCTYKFLLGESMWKVQTREQAQLWCMLIVFIWASWQCFMPPIIVNHAK